MFNQIVKKVFVFDLLFFVFIQSFGGLRGINVEGFLVF